MAKAKKCLYCERTGCKMSDEHLIPEGLGGRTVLEKAVCKECNNGVLSELDNELITQSPLSLIAYRELQSGLRRTWDVDHRSGNVLISAAPIIDERGFMAMWVWPQLILDSEQLSMRANLDELRAFGNDAFNITLIKTAKRTFERYKRGEKCIIFEKEDPDQIPVGHKFPPRLFAKKKITDFQKEMKMIIGFTTNDDKKRLLNAIDRISPDFRFSNSEAMSGSTEPIIQRQMFPEMIVRALTKIMLNVMAHVCERTPIDRANFGLSIDYVREVIGPKPRTPPFGFIPPHEATSIHHPMKGHAIKIVYGNGRWTALFSFFGGELAAIVQLPGLSSEDWCVLDVQMDIGKECTFKKSNVWVPLKGTVIWDEPNKICPSLAIHSRGIVGDKFQIVAVKRKQRQGGTAQNPQ